MSGARSGESASERASAPGSAPAAAFNCLWCGRPHTPRSAADLEVFARLCPDCVGRAQDNEFLRFRLREGLRARAAATATAPRLPAKADADNDAKAEAEMKDYYAARAPEYDALYAGAGLEPLERAVFHADLDAATLWLDGLPLAGEIVELAAGTGWWSPLLAQKGELSIYDAVEPPLELARQRLQAHGLRAHIHVRDAWAEPDRRVDAVFTGLWLSHVRGARLAEFLGLVRRWLKPGASFAFIDQLPHSTHPPTADELQPRELADGRRFTIIKVYRDADALAAALSAAGFVDVDVQSTSRHFVLGRAKAP